MFSLLTNYVNSHGCNTIRQIISRYAPATENDTEAYINNVSALTNFDPDEVITLSDTNFMQQLVAAMSFQENGIEADMVQVNDGLNLLYS
jgi:hypothetical protein